MGNANSVPEEEKVGFHVVQVQPHSPGEAAGLVSFFDFIVAANGVPLNREDDTFKNILISNVDVPVNILVYSSREEKTRATIITPTNKWGGQGLVGISIRFCNFSAVNELVWHVLEVYPKSPAVDAGLVAHSDYIVGTPDQQFADAEDFFAYVEANMRRPIRLYVYSTQSDNVRLVNMTPNDEWGGNGCLGCDVGYGLLHRIPKKVGAADGAAAAANGASVVDFSTRRLHPLMVPTADGFAVPSSSSSTTTATTASGADAQQYDENRAPVPMVAPTMLSTTTTATTASGASSTSRYAMGDINAQPLPANYKPPTFISTSGDELAQHSTAPPPTTSFAPGSFQRNARIPAPTLYVPPAAATTTVGAAPRQSPVAFAPAQQLQPQPLPIQQQQQQQRPHSHSHDHSHHSHSHDHDHHDHDDDDHQHIPSYNVSEILQQPAAAQLQEPQPQQPLQPPPQQFSSTFQRAPDGDFEHVPF